MQVYVKNMFLVKFLGLLFAFWSANFDLQRQSPN